jgi:hypothetical protein
MPPTRSPQPNRPAVSTPAVGTPAVGNSPINPGSLTLAEVARLLSAGGGRKVTPEQVQADVNAGAPANPNGTINLVHYTAWLLREVQSGGD